MRRLVLLALIACGSNDDVETRTGTAAEHGRALFEDPRTSSSPSNVFSCATCHEGEGIHPGYDLSGTTNRSEWWGGKRLDLLEAVNDCRLSFMDARTPWTKDDDDARAIYAFLASLPGGAPEAIPFDVTPTDPPANGDATRGADVYARACKKCHGAAHDGAGRLVPFAPVLPITVNASRAFYVRRVRLGAFASASGSMPPFSRFVLSDADLSALIAFLGF